ncbi:MAG: DUF4397 domain-containing protein [Acidimicrobiales bacterium]|jgi:hypothetical protein|nr:DUF4397 domain-containing protein [Acidimicrobiales bacterium]
MRRTIGLLALGALAASTLLVSGTPASAQGTTQVWAVHGLNLAGQDSQTDGGTPVTVCAGTSTVDADFQFGDVIGPLPLTSGTEVNIIVWAGAGVDCAAPGLATVLIDQKVTPTGDAVALVASLPYGPTEPAPQLAPIPLDIDCTPAGQGRVTAAHTAYAPEVDVVVNDQPVTALEYGEDLTAELPVGTYEVIVALAGTNNVVAGPLDVPVEAGKYFAAFVVGNLPGAAQEVGAATPEADVPSTPIVVLAEVNDVGVCQEPTTTTAAPTTTAKPTTTTAKAAAATATPRYTG